MIVRSPNGKTRIVLVLLFAVPLARCGGPESPSEKSANAFLQGLEYDHRGGSENPPVLIEKSEDDRYCAAGIWSEDVKKRVWVLVRPESDPFKVLPRERFSAQPEDLDQVSRECALSSQVTNRLQSFRERRE